MKNIIHKLNHFTLLIVLSIIVISCDIKNPIEGVETRIDTIERETLITGLILDATTGESIEQAISITFSGKNSNLIIDETNNPISSLSTDNGIINFGVNDGLIFSQNNPLKITVNISSDGYLPTSSQISLDSAGFQQFSISIAKISDLSNNMEVVEGKSGQTDGTGQLVVPIQIGNDEDVAISLAIGGIFKDDSGAPITGEITANLTTVKVNDETINLLPQDLRVNDDDIIEPLIGFNIGFSGENGEVADIQGGENDSIEILIPYEEDFVNPETGSVFNIGDKLEVWNINPETEEWEQDGTVELINEEHSTLTKTNNTLRHRSRWRYRRSYSSYRYYYRSYYRRSYYRCYYYSYRSQRCTKSIRITNPVPGFNVQVFNSSRRIRTLNTTYNTRFSYYTTRYRTLNLQFKSGSNYYGSGGILLGNVNIPSGNCNTTYTSLNWPANLINLNVKVVAKCFDKDPVLAINPNAFFYYKLKDTRRWTTGRLYKGTSLISGLTEGATYEVWTYFDGLWGKVDLKINSASSFVITNANGKISRFYNGSPQTTNGVTTNTIVIELDISGKCG